MTRILLFIFYCKSANIWHNYERKISLVFFDSHCITAIVKGVVADEFSEVGLHYMHTSHVCWSSFVLDT